MINKFHEAINNGQIIGMVMVDFRKAFELVDHTLLLKKLRHYKISDETLLWFSSYLLNRKQKVVINNIESTTENIVCGVPQGTILGPLLFLMFINDLPLYTDNVFTDLYADDTTIYQISNSQHFIEQDLQMALQKLSVWCKLNGMLLNTEKTKVMLITTSQKRLHLHNRILNLTFNNDSLKNIDNLTKCPVGHVYPRRALPPVFNELKICSFDSGDGRMDEFHADSYIPLTSL